ncbi:bifunctional 3,4-dihydroxy-2-butanone-4-phosphate synthase/GTP cyclohydrolase II [Aquirufa antheringensis]|jgi:3,4-dihydroxy 2-butanone 4-phosphate synthase/GTP cyclohydrolase II|uniref:Riboflavin biosynthesis protein RibBA n=1 Tax=Aquirufa antheringensis TaxID=2516559 RepID=A0A4Q9BH66_9BACT|nr:bifunctional 3,4-dihydroxy-2-butanone-4-phosphate synthase/GTP cyclohydrolase II [Aquirufa antheringensis]MCE4216920.1 bifunctional 3,4-dihydroxy-2-butanone-4-phosphate synthase/GTP cyclohydrolase II [Pseudarcicella sp. GAP-15]MCL9968340.1 bifunctional 3,4-dihydroxy-2-butanone-4-phosphate synthase/GTP cyclohydrolase II [Aquirufa antheringensis]MCZ2478149.1 bifunctional 3,4-dihydroxy-2-butanone-4-phosphate synthase/GTP cyclohydrolase II [Aquirufa antheringensis]MCZ2484190.1 bifunctional 3,4-d
MLDKIRLDRIEDALEDIRQGKIIIVADDEDRENEGDMICASEAITPEIVNFMIKEARGLMCVSLTDERCQALGLEMMVNQNTTSHETPFTVSVDLLGNGCTTGISAQDRAKTIQALVDPATQPADLGRPGHIFPLKSRTEGVLRRTGHTEASMDFARLAGFKPSGVLIEILNEDGSMARLPDLRVIADKFDLKLVTIKDLIEYRLAKESLIKREIGVNMPTEWGSFELVAFKQINTGDTHLALIKGSWEKDEPVMVRVHSSCVTGDIFGSCRCDCGEQLHAAMEMVEKEGKGVILYMFQEGRGIGLINKLKAYKLQEQGRDTVEANLELGFAMDERDYGVGAQILRDLGIHKIRLISNNPKKRAGLMGYGLEIVDSIGIEIPANPHNKKYLETKRDKMGHAIR